MDEEEKVRKVKETLFNEQWKIFVNDMNSVNKPLLLNFFGSNYPHGRQFDCMLAKKWFNEGFYRGCMWMVGAVKK